MFANPPDAAHDKRFRSDFKVQHYQKRTNRQWILELAVLHQTRVAILLDSGYTHPLG